MAKLTKYEKETIILFNEGEDTASIYTFNAGLKKRLVLFAKKYPGLCRQERPMSRAAFPMCWTNPGCPSVCNRP